MNSKAIKNKYDFVVIFDVEREHVDSGNGENGTIARGCLRPLRFLRRHIER